ncbi:MAG TPA: serine hydrolase [Micromonospora sp.]|nr:serine hydrolase [Micromonospora sp.]
MSWAELDRHLAAAPGTISVYVARLGAAPAYTRLADAPHYAASTMKVPVLAALYRAGEAGLLDLDMPVPVCNEFDSAQPGAPRFGNSQDDDNDDEVWDRIGSSVSLRWLARRMIVRSSNLATNVVLSHVGLAAVTGVWALVGARHSVTGRGIEDQVAREAGIDNVVTAADLAALFNAIALGARRSGPGPVAGGVRGLRPVARIAAPDTCTAMLEVLLAQERREDLAAGLPPGTRVAHKNGWVRGVRHGAGVVLPDDAPPFVIAVCATTGLASDATRRLIARVSAQAWAARHLLGG